MLWFFTVMIFSPLLPQIIGVSKLQFQLVTATPTLWPLFHSQPPRAWKSKRKFPQEVRRCFPTGSFPRTEKKGCGNFSSPVLLPSQSSSLLAWSWGETHTHGAGARNHLGFKTILKLVHIRVNCKSEMEKFSMKSCRISLIITTFLSIWYFMEDLNLEKKNVSRTMKDVIKNE